MVIGSRGECKGCGLEGRWVTTNRRRPLLVENDGTPHFANCPNADDFRRRRTGDS